MQMINRLNSISSMSFVLKRSWRLALVCVFLLFSACGNLSSSTAAKVSLFPSDDHSSLLWLDRLTWGKNASSVALLSQHGFGTWLSSQLHPAPTPLPSVVQEQINAMEISSYASLNELMRALDRQRQDADSKPDETQRNAARRVYQQRLSKLAREAQRRFVLRALYDENQLLVQMTWFWMNHFNLDARRVRELMGDYEEEAIRPYALGKFRDLLGATLHHPAMLRSLNNVQNQANLVNENYARELMELHTLGVNGGYSQKDVQELALVLTGVGVSLRSPEEPPPKLPAALQSDYIRHGSFEFNPAKHDYRPKVLLGESLKLRGMKEVDEALDRLASAPATARFISRKLALYFVGDAPSTELVDQMASTFQKSDGDILAVLNTMFRSPDFEKSLGKKFSDPIHYVIGSVRLICDDKIVSDVDPIVDWLARMGEPLYGRETPDGYPLIQSSWTSSGQMTTRFEVAHAIAESTENRLCNGGMSASKEINAPVFSSAIRVRSLVTGLGADTVNALYRAKTPLEQNTIFLASPELMLR